jgi:feruloyl esterase
MNRALNNDEFKKDWGYRAMHGSVVLAKQITEDYYKGKISYSYYAGCSTGGKQGMKEVQRFPEDFDGVVVGPPAWWSTRQQGWQMQVSMINLPENTTYYIPPSLFPIIGEEVMRQCDKSDDIEHGIIRIIMTPRDVTSTQMPCSAPPTATNPPVSQPPRFEV